MVEVGSMTLQNIHPSDFNSYWRYGHTDYLLRVKTKSINNGNLIIPGVNLSTGQRRRVPLIETELSGILR